jgi:hypothetical protein
VFARHEVLRDVTLPHGVAKRALSRSESSWRPPKSARARCR